MKKSLLGLTVVVMSGSLAMGGLSASMPGDFSGVQGQGGWHYGAVLYPNIGGNDWVSNWTDYPAYETGYDQGAGPYWDPGVWESGIWKRVYGNQLWSNHTDCPGVYWIADKDYACLSVNGTVTSGSWNTFFYYWDASANVGTALTQGATNLVRNVQAGDKIVFFMGAGDGSGVQSVGYTVSITEMVEQVVENRSGRIDTTPNGSLDLVLHNGSVHVNGNVYKKITLAGTVSNWTGYTDENWKGTWAFISLLGSDYFINRNVPAIADETMSIFSYAGDANYGDAGKQRGFGANGGLVVWKNGYWIWSGQVDDAFAAEDVATGAGGHKVDMAWNGLADPTRFEYEIVYDLEAMSMTAKVKDVGDTAWDTTGTVTLGLRDITGDDDWSDVVTSVQMADNLTSVGGETYGFDYTIRMTVVNPVPGDANMDGKVDVSDLGILAANYGTTVGATWSTGDFNNDTKVDVSDLGILAANYGTGTGSSLDFAADAKAFGLAEEAKEDTPVTSTLGCASAGLPLVAGLLLAGLMLSGLKIKE